MARYHINPETGNIGKCSAKIKCEFDMSNDEHYPNKAAATEGAELLMSKKHEITFSLSKKDRTESSYLASITIKKQYKIHEEIEKRVLSDPMLRDDSKKTILDISQTIANGDIPEKNRLFTNFMDGVQAHSLITHNYKYYTKVTQEFAQSLAKNIGDKKVLDPMAGQGYLAKALREQGVETIATDNKSWGIENEQIEDIDALDAIDKYGKDVDFVIVSWAPYDTDIDMRMLQKIKSEHPHITMINIGEWRGCTNSDRFWQELETNSSEMINLPDHRIEYEPYGVMDEVTFVKP